MAKGKVVQVKNLEVINPSEERLLILAQAHIVAWVGERPGFYQKIGLEGPISLGKNGECYRIRTGAPIMNVEPDGSIVVFN